MIRLISVAVSALAVTACGAKNSNDGTEISLSANETNGAVTGDVDASGHLKIDARDFKANIKIPKIAIDADNFDMNGAHLYPGSKITSIKVAGGDDDKDNGKVRITFTSPANAITVRDWLKSKLSNAGFRLMDSGSGLSGKTDEGKPFTLDLIDDGAGTSHGKVNLGG